MAEEPGTNAIYEDAERLVRLGVSVIPIQTGTKSIPTDKTWSPFTQRIADASERYEWFIRDGYQLGAVCGTVSRGLIVLDFDSPDGFARHVARYPAIRQYPRVKTRKGHHVWLRSERVTKKYVIQDEGRNLEVRAENHIVVCPPSAHRDGGYYEWEIPPWSGIPTINLEAIGLSYLDPAPAGPTGEFVEGNPLEEFDQQELVDILRPFYQDGQRNDLCLAVAGWLADHHVSERDARAVVAALSGDDAKAIDAVRRTYRNIRAGRAVAGWSMLTDPRAPMISSSAAKRLDLLIRWRDPVLSYSPSPGGIIHESAPEHDDVTVNPSHEWRTLLETSPIEEGDLPYHLAHLMSYLRPFTTMFPLDWTIMMTLPFWASLWPGKRLQNLNLAVWTLGLGQQGVGKNIATDELERIVRGATAEAGQQLQLYTAGSPEGLWDALAGEEKQLLGYFDEFGGYLKLLRRDHMQGARESLCSLYDGRAVSYLRAQKNGATIVDPHMVIAATTTPAAIRKFVEPEDMTNGFLSRFMVCAPNARQIAPEYYPYDGPERQNLIRELGRHARRLQRVKTIHWAETGQADPPEILSYREQLGLANNTEIDLDDQTDEDRLPAGRLLARAKKISALLALAESAPAFDPNDSTVVRVGPEHIETAIAIVEHGRAYVQRIQAWVGQSADYERSKQVVAILKANQQAMSQRELCRRTKEKAGDIKIALELAQNAGQVEPSKRGKAIVWQLT